MRRTRRREMRWADVLVAAVFCIIVMALARPLQATDKQIPKNPLPPKTVFVERDSDHSREWTAALIGAGITWFVMHRRAKRNAPPAQVRIVPAECPAVTCPLVSCPGPSERERRIIEACGK